MRIGLGVAWLVVVAAEMIALRSGLGYLIMDSRNAGNRYDLVIAGMIIIGLIGLMLDGIMRLLGRHQVGEVALCALKIDDRSDAQQELRRPTRAAAGHRRCELRRRATASSSPSSGPRAAARSTLMNIIAGFIAPDAGAVTIDGVPRTRPELEGHPDLAAGLGVPVAHRAAEPDVRPARTTLPNSDAARRPLRRAWSGSRASRTAIRTSCRAAC